MNKIIKVVNAVTIAMITMIAGIMTLYSVIWLWTFISPKANFETGPIGLACKIVAIATIIVTAWFVPSTIAYFLKRGKKFIRGEEKVVPMDKYISLIKSKDDTIKKLAADAAWHKVEAIHYKAVAEMYKKELDSLESTPEE